VEELKSIGTTATAISGDVREIRAATAVVNSSLASALSSLETKLVAKQGATVFELQKYNDE